MVPHLTTALTGPLLALEANFLDATPDIERWLRGMWQEQIGRASCRERV